MLEKMVCKNMYLSFCLFFVQPFESPLKQGKMQRARMFSTDLSTEIVDSFPLALLAYRLQAATESPSFPR